VAPPRRHAAPEETIVGLLAAARREGRSFDDAWYRTVEGNGKLVMTNDPRPPTGCILWSTDRDARNESVAAIQGSREFYRRAYDREPPTAADRAVTALADLLVDWQDEMPLHMPHWRSPPPRGSRAASARAAAKTPVPA
jgi:hypothetical protein